VADHDLHGLYLILGADRNTFDSNTATIYDREFHPLIGGRVAMKT